MAVTDYPTPSFRAAIDYKFIRDNVDRIKANCENRKASADPEKVVELYEEFVRIQQETDQKRAARNDNAKAMKGKMEQERRQELIEAGQALKEELAELEAQLGAIENALQVEGQRIPNLTHPSVPLGGEEEAKEIAVVGAAREFGFEPRNHVDIAEALDLVDFDRAGDVSGSKFYYLRNAAAMLELALVNWTLQQVVARGFTPMMTPDIVRASVLEKCGFQPRGSGTQVYSIAGTDQCLTGTAEVPLAGVYMDQVVDEERLPIKMCAFGHCFRTEAGAAGMAGKGLYRVHQFSKVELFVLATEEQSEALHEELRVMEQELFEQLGLHFKVLDMPSGDLGAPAYRKYDIEAWMPGLCRYGEISSASNCTDYQARRLNIRYREAAAAGGADGAKKGKKGKKAALRFVHTLNATACAVPRMLVSILENFQQEDGSVVVPEVLRPYMNGIDVIRPPTTDTS